MHALRRKLHTQTYRVATILLRFRQGSGQIFKAVHVRALRVEEDKAWLWECSAAQEQSRTFFAKTRGYITMLWDPICADCCHRAHLAPDTGGWLALLRMPADVAVTGFIRGEQLPREAHSQDL